MGTFPKMFIDHEDCVSGKSFVSFYNDFEQVGATIMKYQDFQFFLWENIYLPLYRKGF